MLTILDLLNHYLGFFNVNTKWKGQVYTILASVGNFYVLYLAIMHLKNAAYLRGLDKRHVGKPCESFNL
ncbi:hypothetical protein H7R52_04370 [Weissella confusa]|uniref:Uncharacterized protein n=1 Tax=Weissella confusa TaxID=1583 RepID=A0A923NG32_WEICO|nr:hypothetical protein [Weissella confusa]